MRLEDLRSSISDNQFIVDKIRYDFNLSFKRLVKKQNEESENDNNQEVAFLVVNSKENVEIVV
jgi:hypothetical protein